jgi:hypothetical protein
MQRKSRLQAQETLQEAPVVKGEAANRNPDCGSGFRDTGDTVTDVNETEAAHRDLDLHRDDTDLQEAVTVLGEPIVSKGSTEVVTKA